MYGDTAALTRRTTQLRDQAADLRAVADRLVTQADEVAWTGRAADAMRERVRERAGLLRRLAALHDTAADSLAAHLAEVDRLKDAIAQIERRAEALTAEARARTTQGLAEPGDEVWHGFSGPPAGHRDWLGVSLPGL